MSRKTSSYSNEFRFVGKCKVLMYILTLNPSKICAFCIVSRILPKKYAYHLLSMWDENWTVARLIRNYFDLSVYAQNRSLSHKEKYVNILNHILNHIHSPCCTCDWVYLEIKSDDKFTKINSFTLSLFLLRMTLCS